MAMTAEISEREPSALPSGESDQPAEEAPYGYMTDPVTGEKRPKKRPGRRSKAAKLPTGASPTVEQLQALGSLAEDSEDTAPGAAPKGRRPKASAPASVAMPRAGVIAKGVNRLYRRAGRILRLFDYDIGTAVIATTRQDPEDDEDTTVGAAWEEVARTNPRIRALAMKLIAGGAWGALAQAHLPVFMAIAMKESVRKRLPIMRLAEAVLTDEPEQEGEAGMPSGLSQMLGGINPEDMAQMLQLGQMFMGQAAANVPRPNGTPREPSAAPPPQMPVNGAEWPQEAAREHSAAQE